MGVNMWQLILVLLIVILLFGRGRIPVLMGDVAAGIRQFKSGLQDDNAAPDNDPEARAQVEANTSNPVVKAESRAEQPDA